MTLLAPWQAIMAGAFAVPLLLVLYMLKLRRRPVRVSTAMFWASAARDLEANIPFRWLKASWLLLLQLLAVLLLVLALGRPAIMTDVPVSDRIVIVLDRSASTRAVRADGLVVFELLRRTAIERIDTLQRSGFDGEATLLLLDASPAIVSGPTGDLRELRTALEAVLPTDQPGDLDGVMRLAQTIADPPDEGLIETESETPQIQGVIELYTDGAMDATLPSNAVLRRLGLDADRPSGNAGIVTLAARRDVDDPALVRVLVSIVAEVDQPITLPVALSLEGVRFATRPIALTMDEQLPGVARGTLTEPLRLADGGLLEVSIERTDALASDNSAGLRIPPPPRPSILLVQPDRDELQSDASWVLIEVLRAMNPRALIAMTADEFAARGVPENTDLLILDGVGPGQIDTRGVPMLLMGVDPQFEGLRVETVDPRNGAFITWERRHPVWRGAAIDSIRWRSPLRFVTQDDRGVLALGQTGPVAMLDERGGRRRIALSFRPAESTWPTHHSFALFVANAVEFLTLRGQGEAGTVLTTARPGVLAPVELGGVASGRLIDPEGRERLITPGDDGLVRLGLLERAGRYTIAPAGVPLVVGVLNERETRLRQTMFAPETDAPRAQAGVRNGNRSGIDPRGLVEIWWWLVIPAAILLSLEWLLYAWRARV